MPAPRLQNRVAVVTGSSQGLGREIARQFALEGARAVVCADLSPRGADDEGVPTHELVRSLGAESLFVETDVGRAEDVERVVREAVGGWGRVDVFVNNAGICLEANNPAPIDQSSEDAFDRHIRVNTKGTFLGCKYAVRQMKTQEPYPCGLRGWIVNVSSIVTFVGLQGLVNYATSKGAVAALTKTVAIDAAPFGISCNAICPGFTQTPMLDASLGGALASERAAVEASIPLKRFGRAVDQARTVLFYATDDSAWITGTTLAVDGGITCQ